MEWHERLFDVAPLLKPAAITLSLAVEDRAGILTPPSLPVSGFLTLEEGCQRKITEEPHLLKFELRLIPEIAQFPIGDLFVRFADELAQLTDSCHVVSNPHGLETRLKGCRLRVP